MRILLTGSTGRLGGAFLSLWGSAGSGYEVRALTRNNLNLADAEGVRAGLDQYWADEAFDVIVNPAAVSGLEECLDHPGLAQAVNVDAPRVMGGFCAEKGIQMVHFSTDYVFGGEVEGRKSEADSVGPINVYGASKRDGELGVLEVCPSALVCRVSWLFGPVGLGKPSHFDHVLSRAASGEEQHLIGDKYSIPTFTYDIVKWVELLLEQRSSGIYHLCNSGDPESWMSYGEKVCELAQSVGHDVGRRKLVETSISDASFFREKRPVHTAMTPSRLINEGVVTPRHWLEGAKEYLKMR